jgi:uncharacterized protein (DUF2141 family)
MTTKTRLRRPRWLALLAIVVAFTGCPSTPPPSLSVTPDSSTLSAGGAAITLTATAANTSEEVQWKIEGPGSISSASGLSTQYTPPAVSALSSQTTVTLTASLPGAGLSANATITINPVATKPNLGTLEVTVTGLPVGVDSKVTVSGPNGFSQAVTASKTLSDLEPGSYTVSADDVTSGGTTFSATVTGSPATVKANETSSANVAYAAQIPGRGALSVNITGLPDGAKASVTVSGPNGFNQSLTATETISNLEPGTYTVVSGDVTSGGKTFKATITGSPATVEAGKTAVSSVTYAAQTVQPGSLAVSITGLPGGVSANVTVIGPNGFARTLTSSAVLNGLEPGSYALTANDVTSGNTRFAATVTGSPAAVKSGETAISSVSYAAQVGSLQVTISGLPVGLNADVAIAGPDGFNQALTASRALNGLNPGDYAITAKTVRQRLSIVDALFDPVVTGSLATVTASGTAFTSATYAQRPGTGQLWVPSDFRLSGYAASSLAGSGAPAPTTALAPSGIFVGAAFDASGNLWATGIFSNTLAKFTVSQLASGGAVFPDMTITANGLSLSSPFGLAFDAGGNLWVANSNGNSLAMFTPAQLATDGSPAPTVTIRSDKNAPGGSLSGPRGLAFDAGGNLWVTVSPDRLVKFTPAQLAVSGSPAPAVTISSNNNSLVNPIALAFDAGGNLWVANNSADTVVKFAPAQLAATSSPNPETRLSSVNFSLGQPSALAFDASGNLWVTNIKQKTLEMFVVNRIGSGGPAFPNRSVSLGGALGGSSGLAFDPPPTNLPLAQVR